jgi:cytochrome b561
MTICSPTQVRNRSRVRDGRRRFDNLTIGLHWATVALITGMFASAWLLLVSDHERAAMLLIVHRSLGVVTWAVAIVRLAWRFSFAYLPPFPGTMPRAQQRFAKGSEYGLYALLLLQPLTGLAQSLARGRSFMLFEWQVPKVIAGNKALTLLFHQIHTVSAWLLLGLIGLHVLAALFHRLVLKDEVLQSMLPWRSTNAAADAPSSTFAPEDAAARSQAARSQAAMVETVTP